MTAVGSLQAPNYYSSDEEWERCAQDFLGSAGDEVKQTAEPDIELEIQGPDTSEPKVIEVANLGSEPNRYRLFKQIFAVAAIVLIIFAAFIPALAAFFLPAAYLTRRQTAAQNYGNIKDQVTDWTAGAAVVESIKCISPIPKGTYGTPDTTIAKIGLCYLRLVPLGGYARALTGQAIALPA
ncbi:MAG TPA: hypothetical protein PLO43_03185, partial [Chlamydiales bacterium]|nr:hypothetical protein [Chlamydiales bacterium]